MTDIYSANLLLLMLCCRASWMNFSQRMGLEPFDWRYEVQIRMVLVLTLQGERFVAERAHSPNWRRVSDD